MLTIGVDQNLSNIAMYEHTCLENIKKLYKSAGKWDYQQHYKALIESAMFYNTDGFVDNSPMSNIQSATVKNPIARKSIHQFLDTLEVKPKTSVCRFCSAK